MPVLLGIDLGGTKTQFTLGESTGRIRVRHRRPTEPSGSPERDVARLVDDARRLVGEAGLALEDLEAVGVSAPGPLDAATGRLIAPPNLPGWRDVPLVDALREGLARRPVFLENDANAAALAEAHFGAGRGLASLVYLTMSTGVGGGLVLDGQLYRGRSGNAGELGHVPVEWGGEPCACGGRGCLEAYVGGAAWTRRLAATTPADSRVAILAGGPAAARPEHVIAAAKEGDAFARAELERFVDYLGRGLVMIAFAFDPDVIVLGTIAAAAGDLCFPKLHRRLHDEVWPVIARGLRVVPTGLGDRLPDYAGLCVALVGASSPSPAGVGRI